MFEVLTSYFTFVLEANLTALMLAVHYARTTTKKEIAKNSEKNWWTIINHESVATHYL